MFLLHGRSLASFVSQQRLIKRPRIFAEGSIAINHGIKQQLDILDDLVEIAELIDAPLVAANDSHYVKLIILDTLIGKTDQSASSCTPTFAYMLYY